MLQALAPPQRAHQINEHSEVDVGRRIMSMSGVLRPGSVRDPQQSGGRSDAEGEERGEEGGESE